MHAAPTSVSKPATVQRCASPSGSTSSVKVRQCASFSAEFDGGCSSDECRSPKPRKQDPPELSGQRLDRVAEQQPIHHTTESEPHQRHRGAHNQRRNTNHQLDDTFTERSTVSVGSGEGPIRRNAFRSAYPPRQLHSIRSGEYSRPLHQRSSTMPFSGPRQPFAIQPSKHILLCVRRDIYQHNKRLCDELGYCLLYNPPSEYQQQYGVHGFGRGSMDPQLPYHQPVDQEPYPRDRNRGHHPVPHHPRQRQWSPDEHPVEEHPVR